MWRACFTVMVVVAMCLCSLADSQSDLYQFPSKRPDSKRYCGSNLVKILQFLCDGYYNANISPNNYGTRVGRKKSIPEADDDLWLQLQPAEEEIKFPFRPRSSASIFSHRMFKRHSVGVAYECCINKGCTVDELKSYCGR
ncbi:LIRP-like [Cryptotermes secundus]|uniref:LIRP-like n=1 Tax=Cryptotermes secundus TaxID=105785 RepID=UPI000CD7D314|nr:LIRP-like [Cryptotermes secundus]